MQGTAHGFRAAEERRMAEEAPVPPARGRPPQRDERHADDAGGAFGGAGGAFGGGGGTFGGGGGMPPETLDGAEMEMAQCRHCERSFNTAALAKHEVR
ncbi:MAG: C2HC-type zinc finger protein, partial [Hydrogenophaga sp.]